MSRVVFAILLAVAFVTVHAEDYTLGPDSQPHDGVPQGTVTSSRWHQAGIILARRTTALSMCPLSTTRASRFHS